MPESGKELRARDAKRDLGKELLQSVREMKAGRRGRIHDTVLLRGIIQESTKEPLP